MNLTNLASKRYNGLVHDNSIGVESAPNNKGFTVITKKRKLAVSKNYLLIYIVTFTITTPEILIVVYFNAMYTKDPYTGDIIR